MSSDLRVPTCLTFPPIGASAPCGWANRERGMTLIELMVAMTLGLLVLSVVTVIFSGTSGNRARLERGGRLAENAAYAVELLSDEIRMAGFFSETNFTGVTWQVPDPCAATLIAQGWSAVPFTAPVPIAGYQGSDAVPNCFTNRKAGTAVVVTRRVSADTTAPASATGAYFLQASKCASDPAGWFYSGNQAIFTLHKLDCATLADIRETVVRSYYVSTCNECGTDNVPTLKRVELVGTQMTVTPLVEGVENLQVMYGFDTDGDGNADIYRAALSGVAGAPDNDWSNVVAAKLYVLARTTDAEPGYVDSTKTFDLGPAGVTQPAGDAYKRLLLTSMVRLNNPAGVRETP
ncbi:MAG: prepilin-type N-terminal cleavage/methylation domain-containing protein [Betaproteobacteria bacterium]|nr:MAG: prepilin-type N-terminal cleavage/methylation domain-containing protein [Betaproteobacteria bacterium]